MAKRQKRDIYRGRHEAGFDVDKDVDLAHLRELMACESLTPDNANFFGRYVRNIARIMLSSSRFCGYPNDVKSDMEMEAIIDMLKARVHFDGERYPQPTAPFNYLYRVGFHSFCHVLTKYYTQINFVPFSHIDSVSKPKVREMLEIADDGDNWDVIADNLTSPRRICSE